MTETEKPMTGTPAVVENDVVAVAPPPAPAPAPEAKSVDAEPLALVPTERQDSVGKESSKGSLDRDIALAGLEKEKQLSFIKAWEGNEKSKVENKAHKDLSAVETWENTKKANIEAKLKKYEEEMERKKSEYAEKMKNKVALVHKQAEEKRAMVEARRGEEFLKAEEIAAKHRATGTAPKKALLGCF